MESSGIVKEASASDLDKAAALLETIRSENPSLWPNGLTVGHFRPGNLWLIQKSAATEPVGFVGWQERAVEGTPTGYYSIGVLPEHRHHGIAKKAVAQLLANKASGVTRVRALVVPGNAASEHLARSLAVPIEKQAAPPIPLGAWASFASKFPRIAKTLSSPLTHAAVGGYGNMILQDNNMHPGEQFGFFPFRANDKFRNQTAFTNFAIGGAGAGMASAGGGKMLNARNPMEFAKGVGLLGTGGATMSSLIDKDLKMHGHKAIEAVDSLAQNLPGAITRAAKDVKIKGGLGVGGVAAASLIAAALAGGGYQIAKAIKDKPVAAGGGGEGAAPGAAAGGRIRVTLPTKNPNDSETTIDLPFDQFTALSPALRQRIERDTRRRLHAETNARTRRIGTQPLTAVTA